MTVTCLVYHIHKDHSFASKDNMQLIFMSPDRASIVKGEATEQVRPFKYLCCEMSYRNNRDMEEKLTGSVSFVAL
jgi:hypothetical protein